MSNTKEFQPGDTCFTADGRRVEFVAATADGFIVHPYYQMDDDEPYYTDEVLKVEKIFDHPPVAVFDKAVQRLQADIRALQHQASIERQEVSDATKERKALLTKLAQVPALKHLEEFLDGKITHFVIKEKYGSIEISEKEIALTDKDGDRYTKNQKLLCLFGGSDGNLQWEINSYYKGSGDWVGAWPCLSLEEARAKAQELCSAFWGAYRVNPSEHGWYLDRWIVSAKALGFEVPADIAQVLVDRQRAVCETNIRDYEKKIGEAKAALAQLA